MMYEREGDEIITGAVDALWDNIAFVIIVASIFWNMFVGDMLQAIVSVGFLCAFLLSLILIELVALNKQKKR